MTLSFSPTRSEQAHDDHAMCTRRKLIVLCVVGGYLSATVWQVVSQRDDWPLSSFPMYSQLQRSTISRNRTVVVTLDGEHSLRLDGLGSSRQRHLLHKLAHKPKRLEKVLRGIREQTEARLGQSVQAIRSYTETWRIRPGLKGINKPARQITSAIYLPPVGLLARLSEEAAGTAPVLQAVPLAAGAVVRELGARDCGPRCSEVEDRYASGGHALQLDCREGRAEVHVEGLPRGRFSLLARIRPENGKDKGNWRVTLNGKRVGKRPLSRGNLPGSGWLWLSAEPGAPLLDLKVAAKNKPLSLRCRGGVMRVDQIWLAKRGSELPLDTAPRTTRGTR